MNQFIQITSVLFVLILCSCKKNYTCNCTTELKFKTNSGSYDTRYFPAKKEPYSSKMSKKQAESSCEHQRTAIETNFTSAYTDAGQFPLLPGESIRTNCLIEN
jgi:hypothetical protein